MSEAKASNPLQQSAALQALKNHSETEHAVVKNVGNSQITTLTTNEGTIKK